MANRIHVAILFPLISKSSQEYLAGILGYFRQHSDRFEIGLERDHVDVNSLARIRGRLPHYRRAGMITQVWTPSQLQQVRRLGIPIVDIGNAVPLGALPFVASDDKAIGQLAARHLLEKGLRNFAYWGPAGGATAVRRSQSFAECVRAAGRDCLLEVARQAPRTAVNIARERKALRTFLAKCKKPVGILAFNDYWAWDLAGIALQDNLEIPEQVAVVGVGDDFLSTLSAVPLTTIDIAPYRIGNEAARLMHRLLSKPSDPVAGMLVAPARLIVRQSTDILEMRNEYVAKALRYIREHAAEAFDVRDVLRAVPISRRALEINCKSLLGRTPEQQIFHERVELAKRLLLETELPLFAVAKQSGFSSPALFATIFARDNGMSPRKYRVNRSVHKPGRPTD